MEYGREREMEPPAVLKKRQEGPAAQSPLMVVVVTAAAWTEHLLCARRFCLAPHVAYVV